MGYRYILRYYIDPSFHEDERIEELVNFCKASQIEEVMFFYNPEELFQGYPSDAEIDSWFALAKKLKKELDSNSIDMSINPWTTLVHLSRGRYFGEKQQNIQPLVGENGIVSPVTSCPFDLEWQRQLSELFARMAKEVNPTAIWIEDDWRLHNHEPSMNFGGCLCPLHIKRFEESIKQRTTREELMANITALGEAHPWRKEWLKVCADSLVEPAEAIQKTVSNANSSVRLGLMCSVPDVHSVEGRDWQRLKMAFSPEGPMMLRPHVPPYTEDNALRCYPVFARQTVAMFDPNDIQVYPELENSPRCGAYSKSATFSAWEIFASPMYGSLGITINHYDMMGNGIALDPDFGKKLAEIKPRLDRVIEFGANESNAIGPDVLFNPNVAQSAHSKGVNTLSGLVCKSVEWSSVFGALGISHRVTKKFDKSRLTAISDESLHSYSNEEIMEMLAGKLLLDARSTEILVKRGFGEYIGIEEPHMTLAQELGYAYESINSQDVDRYKLEYPRMCAQRDGNYLQMTPVKEAEILSYIHKYDRSILFAGTIKFKNSLGGEIISICHKLGETQFYMSFFNCFRREFIQELVENSNTPTIMGCEKPLNIYCNYNNGEYIIAIINPTSDPINLPKLKFVNIEYSDLEILDNQGDWHSCCLENLPAISNLNVLYLKCKKR